MEFTEQMPEKRCRYHPKKCQNLKVKNQSGTKVEYNIIEKYSCLQKLLRITAYCMRWKTYNNQNKRFTTEINTEELDAARTVLIKLVQGQYFHEEIKCLIAKHNVSKRGKLKLLCPYMDKNGILRVGGRLNNVQSIDAD